LFILSSEKEICYEVSYEQAKETTEYLENYKAIAKFLLVNWAKEAQPRID